MYKNYYLRSPTLGYLKDIFEGDITVTQKKDSAKIFSLTNMQEAQGFAKCLNFFNKHIAGDFVPFRVRWPKTEKQYKTVKDAWAELKKDNPDFEICNGENHIVKIAEKVRSEQERVMSSGYGNEVHY